MPSLVMIGGTAGIGRVIAQRAADRGDQVVITGRDPDRTSKIAKEIGGTTRGLALDLTEPLLLADRLADLESVDHLVLAAIDRDANTAKDYDIQRAVRLVTLKLVGYTEIVHALYGRMPDTGSIVIFGGRAKDRPYPGSTTVSTVNGGVVGLVNSLATELTPIRVNGIHPGIVGDSPFWSGKPLDHVRSRTPGGRMPVMDDIADAVEFLLRNSSVNGINLPVDCGWLLQ
jgi:NAD(P)-dependent dehydrogenase (short-subunit alcohol dehydrogenase family)